MTEVRAATNAANNLALAFPDAATPLTVTVTFADKSGAPVVASHVVGTPGWTVHKARTPIS